MNESGDIDITKCKGEGCKRREGCWRFKAPESEWQSYFASSPVGKRCKDYWPMASGALRTEKGTRGGSE